MRSALCALLVCAALASGAPASESIQVFLTAEQGRRQIFPQATTFERQVRAIPKAVKADLERDLGRPFAEDSLEVFLAYDATRSLVGYAAVTDEIGKFQPITFMVGIDCHFKVQGAAVLIYRESRGGEVRQSRFLRQYLGKDSGDALRINRDIVNITGATLSVRALNFGVKKVLSLVELLYQPSQSAMN